MKARDEVIIEYGGKPEGWSKSGQMCPECQGGSKKESSLRISVQDGWLSWICFRDSCKFSGRHPTIHRREGIVDSEPRTKTPVIVTTPLPDAERERLSKLYDIEEGMLLWAKWEYAPSYYGKPRVRMPILDPNGFTRADTWRSYDEANQPKAIITKRFENEQAMCWYRPRKYGRTLVIVEDQPSALRVCAAHVDALALCGTLISPARITEIADQNYDRVILCLDKDATVTAIKTVAVYRNKLKTLVVRPLAKDVKNMDKEEFQDFIDEVSLP